MSNGQVNYSQSRRGNFGRNGREEWSEDEEDLPGEWVPRDREKGKKERRGYGGDGLVARGDGGQCCFAGPTGLARLAFLFFLFSFFFCFANS